MELMDTIGLMISDDYKERFKAEYWQVRIRYEKLDNMIKKYDEGTLEFKPSNIDLLKQQRFYMGQYLKILKVRAMEERIILRGDVDE